MSRFVNGNSVSGLFLLLLGTATAIYAVVRYPLGTLANMGSAMYPAALGTLLAICGAVILVSALLRQVEPVSVDYRALLFVITGIVLFGLMIDRFGLLPATLVLVLMANLAGGRFRPVQSLLLAALCSAAAWLIFSYGLRIPLNAVKWPF